MEQLTKQSQITVKLNNLRLVLNTIIRNEPLSRADIVRLTHISKPTVSSLIEELLRRKLISEIGQGSSKGGRKPILLRFNSRMKYFLAFDMGRAGYRYALADLKGNILKKDSGEFEIRRSFRERLEVLKEEIFQLLDFTGISPQLLLKIICIAPGVYVEMGKALKWIPSLQKNENNDMKDFFSRTFHNEIISDHSTKLSLLGEKIAGKARGYKNVIYIDLSYGLGCSIMINGHIYFGPNNSAGEMGYFYSNFEEFESSRIMPYELGALENHISGCALQKKGLEAARRDRGTKLYELVNGDIDSITAKTVFDAALLNDPAAQSILKESFHYFNLALCNIINMLTPELVIFGGGFSKAGNFLLSFIEDEIKDKVLIMPKLEISELKNEASIIGGIQHLIDHSDFLVELQ